MRIICLTISLFFSLSLFGVNNQYNSSLSTGTFLCREVVDLEACGEFPGCSADWQKEMCRGRNIYYFPIQFMRLVESSFDFDPHALLGAPILSMLMILGPDLLKEIVSITQIPADLLLRARCRAIFRPFNFNLMIDEAIVEGIDKQDVLLGNCELFLRNTWKEFAGFYEPPLKDLVVSPWRLTFEQTEAKHVNEKIRQTGVSIRKIIPRLEQNSSDDIYVFRSDSVNIQQEKIDYWAQICRLPRDKVAGVFLQSQKHQQSFEQEIANFCLFQGIERGELHLVKISISLGANIHALDWVKKTPITRAIEGSFTKIVDYLKSQGALSSDRVAEVINNKGLICLKRLPENESEGYCLIKDYDFDYTSLQAQLIMDQIQFWEKTGLGEIQIPNQINRYSVASNLMSSYVGNFNLFDLLFSSKYTGGMPLWRGQAHFSGKDLILSRQADAINFEILGAPKSADKTVVYRGITKCSPNMFLKPGRILSTTANPLFALGDYHNFYKDSCFLEIHLPPGFPSFFVDISFLRTGFSQQEFLLPMFYLNNDFEIVEAEYELISESPKDFISSYPKLDGAIEYQFGQVHTYLLSPKNPIIYSPERFGSFDQFQALYVEELCDPKNLGSVNELERICSKMTTFWKAPAYRQ
jgi:hypothetical protein